MKTIQRLALRDQVYEQLLRLIVTGQFAPGAKIKDTELAGRFGTSRTPIRETLLRLTKEGFLHNAVGRGFMVRELDSQEIDEAYPILWNLETMALKAALPLGPPRLEELRALNVEIGAIDQDPLLRLEKDIIWHRLLVASCGNQRLLAMIDQLKLVIQRYLHAYILLKPHIEPSLEDHDRIVYFLGEGRVDAAAKRLKEHWRRNLEIMTEVFRY